MSFEGKNYVVVGGTSGIGASVVQQLLSLNANVWNLSRSRSGQNGVKDIELDVLSDFRDIDELPEEIHGLVYAPGSINLKPFQSLQLDDFQKDFEINVKGAVKVLKAAMKGLKKAGQSSVVMYSTVAAFQGMNFHASVAASKAALEGMGRSLAAEWSRNNIRVNMIAPSLTDTPMAKNLLSTDDKRKTSEERHPIKKVGSPEEIAKATLNLLSEDSGWITGQTIHIDGGLSVLKPI